jgi:hypothetical protein
VRRLVSLSAIVGLLIAAPVAWAAGQVTSTVPLSGAKEVPAVSTSGTGSAKLVLNAARTQISYTVTYSGLSGPLAAAHLHVGAAGTNGPVVLPLKVGPSPMTGTLTAADLVPAGGVATFADAVDRLLSGQLYVNLHTAQNPGGEIRGQVPALNAPATDTDPVPANQPGDSTGLLVLVAAGVAAVLTFRRRVAFLR